jgi:hypothetical protein
MRAGDPFWAEVPANVSHLSGRDSALPDELVDRILRAEPVEAGAAPEALALAGMVTTLRRPARPVELRGAASAVAAYRREVTAYALKEQRHRRLSPSVSARIVAAVFAGSLGMGGIAVAAVDGSLPAPLQHFAHVFFGAPPAPVDDDRGGDDAGGTDPAPTLPDTSTLGSQASPGTKTSSVPADPAASDDLVVEPGGETQIGAPGTSPATGTTDLDATDSTSPEIADAAPPADGHPAGAPRSTGGQAPEDLPTGPPSEPPAPAAPPAPQASPPAAATPALPAPPEPRGPEVGPPATDRPIGATNAR